MGNELESALHVVATPIGCLQDISSRALAVLREVDWIAAEDTRQTSKLLQYYSIRRPLLALHAHNEANQSKRLVAKLQLGERGALVSDAGTPLVSDPGAVLVSACHDAGVKVVPVPGACAAVAALSAAGFGGGSFKFHGFLPPKQAARQDVLRTLANQECSVVFYEAPHRIEAMLADLVAVLGGERELLIAREITKKFETIVRDRADKIIEMVKIDENMRRGRVCCSAQWCQQSGAGYSSREAHFGRLYRHTCLTKMRCR